MGVPEGGVWGRVEVGGGELSDPNRSDFEITNR